MLTPERRAELRTVTLGRASLTVLANDITALLDAADERDRLRAAVRQIADACHWSHDPSGDPEALVAHIGQLQQIAEDACDERDRLAAAVERVRALADNWERLDRALLAAGAAGMSMPAVDAVRQLRERLSALDGTDE